MLAHDPARCGQSARLRWPCVPHSRLVATSASGGGLRWVASTRRSIDARTAVLERGMLKGLRAAANFFNEKVGFSRLGVVLRLTIIIVAAVVLYHILRDIDLDELVDAIEATDWRTLVIAGLF